MDVGQHQHAGVLAIGGVGGAAEHGGQRGGQTVAHQGAVQAGVLKEVALSGGGDGGHIADVLHHGGQGDGGHDQNGGHVELGQLEGGQAHQTGLGHGGEIHQGLGGAVSTHNSHAAGIHNKGGNIGDHHAHEDGDDLEHAAAPDVEHDDGGQGDEGQGPAAGGVVHSRGGQGQADAHDDGAGDHGGQKAHDLLHARQLDDQGQDQVQQTGHHNAAAGVAQLILGVHGGVDAAVQIGHGGKAAQKGEGGAQEGGHLELRAHMEEQGADAGKEQGGLDAQGQTILPHQNGHQNGGAKHGEHVLQTQDEHLGHAQGPGVADRLIRIHVFSPFLFKHAQKKRQPPRDCHRKKKRRIRLKCSSALSSLATADSPFLISVIS